MNFAKDMNVLREVCISSWIKDFLGVSRDGENRDADFEVFDLFESEPTTFCGSTCGENVVNKQDVFSFQSSGVAQSEDVMHVVIAFFAVFMRLSLSMMNSNKVVCAYWALKDFGDTLADE